MRILFITIMYISVSFAHSLEVNISNIQNIKGKLYIGVYNKKDGFGIVGEEYIGVIKKITSNTFKYKFQDISGNTYAISVFQDLNDNSVLDKNFLGKPVESYGFSNNIRHIFSSATFDESKFELTKNKIINIIIE